jgi:hypothetical protein
MRDVIDVPKDDKFQVIAEHPVEALMSARAIWATITAKISS